MERRSRTPARQGPRESVFDIPGSARRAEPPLHRYETHRKEGRIVKRLSAIHNKKPDSDYPDFKENDGFSHGRMWLLGTFCFVHLFEDIKMLSI
jgi:hypothetical protein